MAELLQFLPKLTFIVFIFIVVVIVDFNAFAVGHSFSKVKVRLRRAKKSWMTYRRKGVKYKNSSHRAHSYLGRISANHGSTVKRVVRVTILRSFKCYEESETKYD